MGFPIFKNLTDLGFDDPVVALRQQFAQTFFTAAIGRRGVDKINAQRPRQIENSHHVFVIGNFKFLRVFHLFIAADLDCAQTQHADIDSGCTQRSFFHHLFHLDASFHGRLA